MSWIRASLQELWGLFVDDGLLAILACLWIGAIAFAVRFGGAGARHPRFVALGFVVGLLAILAESVRRAARTKGSSKGPSH